MAGRAFEAARQIHFATEYGVIQDVILAAHQARDDGAGVDAGAECEQWQRGQERLAGELAQGVVRVAAAVLGVALAVERVDGALRGEGRLNGVERVRVARDGCAPESHHAVADVFVQRAAVPLDEVGDGLEVEVHGGEHGGGLFIEAGARAGGVEVKAAGLGDGFLVAQVGNFREAPDVREKHGDIAMFAAEAQFLQPHQFGGDLGRDDLREDRLQPRPFAALEERAPRHHRDMRRQRREQRQRDRQPQAFARVTNRAHGEIRDRPDDEENRAVPHFQPQRRRARREPQQRHEQQIRTDADAPYEAPGEQAVQHVPVAADQERVLLQRRRAVVRDVVAAADRADHDELVLETHDRRAARGGLGGGLGGTRVQFQEFVEALLCDAEIIFLQ